MAQKSVITEVKEIETVRGEHVLFPQNKVLYVDKLTSDDPDTSDEREPFRPHTMEEVFERYQPAREGVMLIDSKGDSHYEDFRFRKMSDFDDEQLMAQSPTLAESGFKLNAYQSVVRQLERNRDLRNVLTNPEARKALIEALTAIRAELPKMSE